MIEKWVLFLVFTSPLTHEVTTTETSQMASKLLCEGAGQHVVQEHGDGVEAMCLQAARNTPEDRMED